MKFFRHFMMKRSVSVVESSQTSYLDQFNINLQVSTSRACGGPRALSQTLFMILLIIVISTKMKWC